MLTITKGGPFFTLFPTLKYVVVTHFGIGEGSLC